MHPKFNVLFFLLGGTLLFGCKPGSSLTEIAAVSETATPVQRPSSTAPPTRVVTLRMAEPTLPPTPTPAEMSTSEVLANLESMVAVFNQKIQGAEWIRKVHEQIYFNNVNDAYDEIIVVEQWHRYGAEGELLEGYNWTTGQDGFIQQEAVNLNGRWVNLTFKQRGQGDFSDSKPDYFFGFVDRLKKCRDDGDRLAQEDTVYNTLPAWRFTCLSEEQGYTFLTVLILNKETGIPLAKETNLVLKEGSLKLVSGAINMQIEIGALPPLERLERMMEEAEGIP